MNSFENPFVDSTSPLSIPETPSIEKQLDDPENPTESVEIWKTQILAELNLQAVAPRVPESDLSLKLRELVHFNPYASQLLASLGYQTPDEAVALDKAPGAEKQVWKSAATDLLQLAGEQMVERAGSDLGVEDKSQVEETLRERGHNLIRGCHQLSG